MISVAAPRHGEQGHPSLARRLLTAILGRKGGEVGTLLLVAVFFYLFVIRGMKFFAIPSGSMEPTLLPMDQIVTLREKTYDRGDIVVLRDPEDEDGYIVKRIAAVGGDTVFMSAGAVNVNGRYVSEPYVQELPAYLMPPTRIPEGSVFVLGDNRNNSEDSHVWAQQAQPADHILGRVRFIYYPYARLGVVKPYPPVTVPVVQPSGA